MTGRTKLTLLGTPMLTFSVYPEEPEVQVLLAEEDLPRWTATGRDPACPNVTWFFRKGSNVQPALPFPGDGRPRFVPARLLMFPLSMMIARFPNCGEEVDVRLLHPRAKQAHAKHVEHLATEQLKLSKKMLEELRAFYVSGK